MPELPEVETIKRELGQALVGKKIIEVIVNNPKVIREPGEKDFIKGLKNKTIKNILRKAKLLILELSDGKSLTIHLKMTGQLVLRLPLGSSLKRATCGERSPELVEGRSRTMRVEGLVYPGDGKISRVSFKLSDGKSLDFNDQRLFAELRLVDDWHNLKFVQGLGPEPFEITQEQFTVMLGPKKTKIKLLIMDQKFISGIGNLYAAESLFRAKINPARPAQSLSDKEKGLLYREIIATLREAIKYKGSSVDQYVRLSGNPGDYVKFHKVYDRRGLPCLVCKTPIKRVALGGRGTYFCPRCQK